MIEASEHESDSPAEDEPGNPSSDELDVEGPNESAPGHEPTRDDDGDGEHPADRPSGRAE